MSKYNFGIQLVENSISVITSHLESARADFKKINILRLVEIKEKYNDKLTIGIVIQESKQKTLLNDFWEIENRTLPLIEREIKKLSSSKRDSQKLWAFRESDVDVNPYDYLDDLPRDLYFMGRAVLKTLFAYQTKKRIEDARFMARYKPYEGYLDRFSYFNIFLYGFFWRYKQLAKHFRMFLWDYTDELHGILYKWKNLLNTEIDTDKSIKEIKSEADVLFGLLLDRLKEVFPLHEYRGHIYTRMLKNDLNNLKSSLERHVEGSKSLIERFEKESGIPKPKKPWLFKTKKYKNELMKWEEEIGKGRINYEILILDYVVYYIELEELKRQWNQLREYISELIGTDTELVKFGLS